MKKDELEIFAVRECERSSNIPLKMSKEVNQMVFEIDFISSYQMLHSTVKYFTMLINKRNFGCSWLSCHLNHSSLYFSLLMFSVGQ